MSRTPELFNTAGGSINKSFTEQLDSSFNWGLTTLISNPIIYFLVSVLYSGFKNDGGEFKVENGGYIQAYDPLKDTEPVIPL